MADFAAILRKNIEKLGETTPELREKVYGKAREALERKIAAIEPAPAQAVIDRQFAKLDEAVSEIEAEYAPPTALEDQLDDLDTLLGGEGDLETANLVVPEAVEEAPPTPVDADTPVETVESEAAPEPVEPSVPDVAVDAEPSADEEDPLRAFLQENVDTLSMPETATLEVPETQDTISVGAPMGAEPQPMAADERPTPVAQSGPAWGRLGVLVLIVAVLGGGGYFASTLPQVQSALGLNNSEEGVPVREVSTTPVEDNEEAADTGTLQEGEVDITVEGEGAETVVVGTSPSLQPKFTQRLTEDGLEVDEGPAQGAPTVGEGTSVSDLSPVSAPDEQAVVESDETTEEPQAEGQTPLRVGQRAIFYEERTGTEAGTAVPGTVIWTQVQDSPGADLPLEPAIRGEVSVPDLDLSLVATIRRNGDQTFPASHIIELSFEVSEGFTGRGISEVDRVNFKSTEQDPGTTLIGIIAPIDANFFLVALNSADEAVRNNINLIRRENWIDIPLQYVSGRRALVTIEKGTAGERIFTEVFDFWDANPLPIGG
ncbi:MAG: hypothetical protein AAFY99_08985 [Pseudomonadota bacterium]